MPALVTGEPLPLPGARAAVSTSLAFGGSNAALVFSRWQDAAGRTGPLEEPILLTGLGTIGAWGSGSDAPGRGPGRGARPWPTEVDRAAGYHLRRRRRAPGLPGARRAARRAGCRRASPAG